MIRNKIFGILLIAIIMASTAMAYEYSGSSGSSGSYGGGGVITNEPPANIVTAETQEHDLRAGKPTTYNFAKPDLGVYQVIVIGKENEDCVALRAELLKGLSPRIKIQPSGDVYKYVNLWSGSKRLMEITIKFKVETKWLTDHNIASVNMLRWNNSIWNMLPTTEVSRNDTYAYYEAQTAGFSSFAIVGLKGMAEVTATSVGETPAKPEKVANATAVPTEKTPGFEIALFVAVFSAVYLFRRKRG